MSETVNPTLPPFHCTYTPSFTQLLHQLRCTVALSTYQAGKVVFISPKNENQLIQLPRSFKKAMGLGLHKNHLVVATMDEVVVLVNSPELARHYPKKTNTYDALYMPRAVYHTGMLDIHDIDWGKGGEIYAVNTSFSCLIRIDHHYSFTPIWKPPFISKLASEDRCHLNGMAMENGAPRYVSAFNQGDQPQAWRAEVTTGGILMDVPSNELVATGLPMPHSPRIHQGQLYLLLSATGDLVRLDPATGQYEVVCRLNGFVRGLAFHGDFAFVGLSKLRSSSKTFSQLSIADKAVHAGVAAVHLPTGRLVGEMRYLNTVDEIYDVQVFPNIVRPNILNTDKPEHKLGLTTPQTTYWAPIPEEEK
jgi:uncharacterized protein (TIGR03032 family)